MIGIPLSDKKVDEFVKQCKHFNVFPIFLDEYLDEKGVHPLCSRLCDLVKECHEYLMAMTDIEVDSLVNNFPEGIKAMIDHRDSMLKRDDLLKRIAFYYMVSLVYQKYLSFKQIISSDLSDSEVLKMYPELQECFDEEGLLNLDQRFRLSDGGVHYKEHILHYHQFLRRDYSSNPNYDFLGRFAGYYYKSGTNNKSRIAIDHNRIMPKAWFKRIMERDTWFGPRFDRSRLDDPNYVGLTVVKRNKNSLFEHTNHLDRTECYWSHRNGVKSLEIEEISSEDFLYDSYYINRYTHSERDVEKKLLRHFDGAVKVYLKDNYMKRFETSMPKEPKCYKKIKLFRIDGDIDIDGWIELTSFFYKSNEMIIEYFNPKDFEQIFEERVRDFKAWKEKQNKINK